MASHQTLPIPLHETLGSHSQRVRFYGLDLGNQSFGRDSKKGTIGLILASAFSAIMVYAQELLPSRVGMVAGLFFGFAFGMGGVGAAVLGWLADQTSIGYVYKVCSFLPLIGLFTPPTMLRMAPFGAFLKGRGSPLYTIFTASVPISTRLTIARKISRRAFQSATCNPVRTRSANPSKCPIAAANSVSSDSAPPQPLPRPATSSVGLWPHGRGSNSALSNRPSSYASISRAIPPSLGQSACQSDHSAGLPSIASATAETRTHAGPDPGRPTGRPHPPTRPCPTHRSGTVCSRTLADHQTDRNPSRCTGSTRSAGSCPSETNGSTASRRTHTRTLRIPQDLAGGTSPLAGFPAAACDS